MQTATIIPISPVERFEAAARISSALASKNDVGAAVGADDGLSEVMPVEADNCKSRRTIAGSTKQLAVGSMHSYPLSPHTYSAYRMKS